MKAILLGPYYLLYTVLANGLTEITSNLPTLVFLAEEERGKKPAYISVTPDSVAGTLIQRKMFPHLC